MVFPYILCLAIFMSLILLWAVAVLCEFDFASCADFITLLLFPATCVYRYKQKPTKSVNMTVAKRDLVYRFEQKPVIPVNHMRIRP